VQRLQDGRDQALADHVEQRHPVGVVRRAEQIVDQAGGETVFPERLSPVTTSRTWRRRPVAQIVGQPLGRLGEGGGSQRRLIIDAIGIRPPAVVPTRGRQLTIGPKIGLSQVAQVRSMWTAAGPAA
jgi:hypothetical protein